MRRRALLSTAGAALAVSAGCLSGDDTPAAGDDDTTRTDTTATDEPTSQGTTRRTTAQADVDLDVSLDAFQPAVVQLRTDSIDVWRDDGPYLFLWVDATAAAEPPARDDFAFELDEADRYPMDPDGLRLWREYGDDTSYGDGNAEGWLLFDLPRAAPASNARLTWPGGEWRAGESLRTRIAAEQPSMSMSFSVTEEVPAGEHPTVTVTVQNEGDVDGRFVGALNRTGPRIAYIPVDAPSMLVPAGGSKTWEHTGDFDTTSMRDDELGDGNHDVTYHFDSTLGRESAQVYYVAADG